MKKKIRPGSVAACIVANVTMALVSISCIFPVVWIFYSSVKSQKEFDLNPVGLPKTIDFENYKSVLASSDILKYMFNTFRNTFVSLALIILIGFVTGYFLSRFKFKGRNAIYGMYMLGMLVPIHALLVPMYMLFSKTGLTDRWFSVVLPDVAFGLPMAIFLIESFISTIPKEMDEAAAIDGAGFSRRLFTIIMPLSVPILVTVGIISFFNCWNEFSYSLVLLQNKNLFGLPLGMTMFKGMYATNYPKMMTTMVISIIPALILYFAFSKHIINGMMAGAVKG